MNTTSFSNTEKTKRFLFFPLFFPKTITKIIENNKPVYYDIHGNITEKTKRFLFFPLFFPKTITKIIENDKPVYYDIHGNIIVKDNSNLNILPTISQPIYDLNADTTATIRTTTKQPEQNIILTQPEEVGTTTQTTTKKHIVYCMKCKEKRLLKNVTINKMDTSKGIKFFAKGTCTVCGFEKCNGFIKGV